MRTLLPLHYLSLLAALPAPAEDDQGAGTPFMEEDWEDPEPAPVPVPVIEDIEFRSADTALQASEKLNRLHAQMKAALVNGGAKTANIERMVNDLGVGLRDVREKLAMAQAPANTGGSDGDLRAFIARSANGEERLRWVGKDDTEGIYRAGILDDDVADCGDWHKHLRELFETRSLARTMVKSADPHNPTGPGATPKLDRLITEHLRLAPPSLAKIFSGASGAGGDWQQVTVLPQIATELRHPLQVEALFDVVEMPTKGMSMPFDSGVARPYRKGTPTTNNPANYPASDSSTTSRTLTADSLAVQILVFDDADEDAVIASRAFLSRKVVDGLRYGFEDCIVNGDTGTHQDTLTNWNPRSIYNTGDSAFGGLDDHRRSFIGLRAAAFDASATRDANADTAFATGTLKSARLALSAPHGVDGDLVYLTSIEHYLTNILTDSNTLTVDKMGQLAAILTGQVASVLGVRIVLTEFLTSDLAATGLYTGAGNSKTGGLLFNRKRFVVGNRRGVMLETTKDVRNGVHYLVATRRGTFKAVDATSHKAVHFSFNL